MRVRQLVLVANERDPIVTNLEELFNIQVSFYDPGIKFFGLENAVLPVGDTFLEVVSPIEDKTTAGRYLERRGGNGGYMVIIQVEDFLETKKRVEDNNMRVVYELRNSDPGTWVEVHQTRIFPAVYLKVVAWHLVQMLRPTACLHPL